LKSRVKLLRAERGWTQEYVSKRVGVSRYAINALENERHDPSLDLAFRLASAFGLTVEDVFTNPHVAISASLKRERSG
jgi:putative transcriptional regulator